MLKGSTLTRSTWTVRIGAHSRCRTTVTPCEKKHLSGLEAKADDCDAVDTQAASKDKKRVDVAEDAIPSLQTMDLFFYCIRGR